MAICITSCVISQELEPLELVEKVFTEQEFIPEIAKYSSGEYNGNPSVNDLAEGTNTSFRLLNQTNKTAVVNVTLTDSLGKGFDTYVHLMKTTYSDGEFDNYVEKKETNWKIVAFRALAMTGMLEDILQEMEGMTENQLDSFLISDMGKETFESKEDFYREMENIKLNLALDNEIIEHFESNRQGFEILKDEILEIEANDTSDYKERNLGEKIKTKYKKLLISTVSDSFYCTDCIKFVIGGMIDNSVGYMYIPNENQVPDMSPSRLIMLREIGGGWYLFKTT